jgi:ribonuclease HI
MADQSFTCQTCSKPFTLKAEILARYPGWQPQQCLACKNKAQGGAKGPAASRSAKTRAKKRSTKRGGPELGLTTSRVLERYTKGPHDGIFTDGACTGNPGPGGWGAVWVKDQEILAENCGYAARTTNNRMELTALIEAYRMLPKEAEVTLWSDSKLCVQTLNEWAAGWQRLGWKRKTGPIKNLELVQEAYALHLAHPRATLRWIKAHNGSLWNEYADALATAYLREER